MGKGVAFTEKPDFPGLGLFFGVARFILPMISGEKLQTLKCSDIYPHLRLD